MQSRNARIGLVLFVIYLALYGGFVLLSAFAPQVMETTPAGGINLAVWYGLGLIIVAFLMALLYGVLCGMASRGDSPIATSTTNADDDSPRANAEGGQ